MPVHKGDADQARRTLELSLELKFQTEYPLVVIYPYSATPVIQPVLEAAKKAFKTVMEYQIPSEVQDGWPQGPNQMFFHAVSFLEKENQVDRDLGVQQMWFTEPNGNFLWWEPDAIPMHPTWIDRIATAYNLGRKPFMGAMVETIRYHFPKDQFGQPDKTQPPFRSEQDGIHMSGVGVYPRSINFSAICKDGSKMEKMIEWFNCILTADEAFDILFQNEICKRDASGYANFTPSPTIAHNSRSRNYRISKELDGTYVLSDKDPQFPNGADRFLWTTDGSIGTVLAHGAKDGSAEMVSRQLNGLVPMPLVNENKVQTPASLEYVSVGSAMSATDPYGLGAPAAAEWPDIIGSGGGAHHFTGTSEPKDELTPEQQAQLDKLLSSFRNKGANAQKASTKAVATRKAPDVSHIDKDAFLAFLDANGWHAALKEFKVSPAQGGALKAMRETATA